MTASYRGLFGDRDAARFYDEDQYRPGSFWDALWSIERDLIDRIVEDQRRRTGRIEYLDFACGTGRVLSYVEPRVDAATGIDVSPAMLERARARVASARLIQRDITVPGAALEGPYDLVTAFRFVLNAEPELREAGVRSLARCLRDERSRLVINTHGNPYSYKGLVVPIRRWLGRRGGEENLMPAGELADLLRAAGLEVVERHGMGLVPAPIWRGRAGLAVRTERLLAGIPLLSRLGVNQVLVCRLERR